jgi:hypothetical protein
MKFAARPRCLARCWLCRGSTRRFELDGTDLELALMNDNQEICER